MEEIEDSIWNCDYMDRVSVLLEVLLDIRELLIKEGEWK